MYRPTHKHRGYIGFAIWFVLACFATGWPLYLASNHSLSIENAKPCHFWRQWEKTAIICECLYAFLFFGLYAWAKPSVLSYISWKKKFIFVAMVLGGCFLLILSYKSSTSDEPVVLASLLKLTLAAGLFGIIDGFLGYGTYETSGNGLTTEQKKDKTDFQKALWFSDLPVIIGLGLMLLYVMLLTDVAGKHTTVNTSQATMPSATPASLQAFVAGGIAFQLLWSFIIFGLLMSPPKGLFTNTVDVASTSSNGSAANSTTS